MPSDPRPRRSQRADGTPNPDLERRFEVIFATLRGSKGSRPTDAASGLTFLQELWDRLQEPRS